MKGFLLLILVAGICPGGYDLAWAAGSTEEGAYEIDYEEESEETEPTEEEALPAKSSKTPARAKVGGKVGGGGPAVQGSRAKNRFAPILKSETRSVYKKDGKTLDVDTD